MPDTSGREGAYGGVATRGHGERGGVRRRQVPRSGTQETVEGSGVSEVNGVPRTPLPDRIRILP